VLINFGVELYKSHRNEEYDGWLNGQKCEIIYYDGSRTNVGLGESTKYDLVLVVRDCRMTRTYIHYRFLI